MISQWPIELGNEQAVRCRHYSIWTILYRYLYPKFYTPTIMTWFLDPFLTVPLENNGQHHHGVYGMYVRLGKAMVIGMSIYSSQGLPRGDGVFAPNAR